MFICFMLFFFNGLFSQNQDGISIIVFQDYETIHIGEVVTYAIKVYTQEDIKNVHFPLEIELPSHQTFDIKLYSPEKLMDGRIEWRMDYSIYYYELGNFDFPALQVNCEPEDSINESIDIMSEKKSVFVESLFKEEEEVRLKDLKGFQKFRTWNWLIWFIGIIFLIKLIVFFIVYYFVRTGLIQFKKKMVLSPFKEAEEALDQLTVSQINESQLPHFYFKLTETLKRYLERTYEIPALEWTTTELLVKLKEEKYLEHTKVRKLADWLEMADRIKFSDYRVLEEQLSEDKTFIRSLITSIKESLSTETTQEEGK